MYFSRHIACAILSLLISLSASLCAEELSEPLFVAQSFASANEAPVIAVESLANTDVVFIKGGLDQNFGEGVKCIIERSNEIIAEIVLVKVGDFISAGLILEPYTGYTIQSGDMAKMKTVSWVSTK